MRKYKEKEENNAKQETLRGINAFMQMVEQEQKQEILEEDLSYIAIDTNRFNVPPPEFPQKTKYNRDGVVDVITFCEHPYFLNLRLTPWQTIILKLLYSGENGNIDLKIENERTDTCVGCIWVKNCRESDNKIHYSIINKNNVIPPPYLPIENSRCLACSRFPEEYRNTRFEYLEDHTPTAAAKNIITKLREREVTDKYDTEQDIFEKDLNPDVREQIRRKIGLQFQELILVLGRRSGKSFLVSVIALYEVYKLLMMGHPQKRFSLMDTDIIEVLNVANSERQAESAIFKKIKALVENSPYFMQYVGKNPTSLEIYFLTEFDKKENERRIKDGQAPLTGSIQLRSGHSNSKTLVGDGTMAIIIDEMAVMARESDGGIDDDLYSLLKPSIGTFGMEGKMICISNPLGPAGKFYDLYLSSFVDDSTLMIQLPTWLSNPTVSQAFLDSEQLKDPQNFGMHYGAEFGITGASPFLPDWSVHAAFEKGAKRIRANSGYSQIHYFAHLDAAESSDNYTMVIIHLEPILDTKTPEGKPLQQVVVDYMHIWRPNGNYPVDSNEVDTHIVDLATRFKFSQISYDQWGSTASITKLKGYGLNVVKTTFSRNYQNLIFSEMYDLFVNERIEIYNVDTRISKDKQMINLEECTECRRQLLTLQKKWRANNTYKIEALRGNHDDFADCIAAASFEALKFKEYQRLAKPKSVYTGNYFR